MKLTSNPIWYSLLWKIREWFNKHCASNWPIRVELSKMLSPEFQRNPDIETRVNMSHGYQLDEKTKEYYGIMTSVGIKFYISWALVWEIILNNNPEKWKDFFTITHFSNINSLNDNAYFPELGSVGSQLVLEYQKSKDNLLWIMDRGHWYNWFKMPSWWDELNPYALDIDWLWMYMFAYLLDFLKRRSKKPSRQFVMLSCSWVDSYKKILNKLKDSWFIRDFFVNSFWDLRFPGQIAINL